MAYQFYEDSKCQLSAGEDLKEKLWSSVYAQPLQKSQFIEPSLIVDCKKIVLKQDAIEIEINIDKIKQFNTITIDGRTYKYVEEKENEKL